MSVRAAVSVVGVTFDGRQEKLRRVREWIREGRPPLAILQREPDNPYDSNAIGVYVAAGGEPAGHVGFVPGPLAKKWAARMDRGEEIRITRVRIEARRRQGKIRYGCEINVELEDHDE